MSTLSGNSPFRLEPYYSSALNNDYDPFPILRDLLVAPVFRARGTGAVSLVDDNGNHVDEDMFFDYVQSALDEHADVAVNDFTKNVYQQALINFDEKNPRMMDEVFVVQAAAAEGLPAPSARIVYQTALSVIPSAKELLAHLPGAERRFFAALGFLYAPNTLGFWFEDNDAFTQFLQHFDTEVQSLQSVLPQETFDMAQRLITGYDIKKEIADGLQLRKGDVDGNGPFTFPRLLVESLLRYAKGQQNTGAPATMGVLPFSVGELMIPRSIVFANVELHAQADAKRIDAAWGLINVALNSSIKIVSNKALSKLTAVPRAIAKGAAAANAGRSKTASGRQARLKLRKQSPNTVDIRKDLIRALRRMKKVNMSQNVFRNVRISYSRANRRNPDDYNLAGKIVSRTYLPDLHVYLDTSGSISESNYQASVIMLIKIAKSLGVNIYFNSFSDVLSQCVLLKTEGKSVKQIWNEFRKIPKVTGGTEFSLVWEYIQASPKRQKELSLMITDFGWNPPSRAVYHPKNLYYAPCADMDWSLIKHYAKSFTRGMQHIDPTVGARLLGMFR